MQDLRPRDAALSMLGAMAILGLVDNFVVLIAELTSLWQFHLLRSLIALPVLWAVTRARGQRLWPRKPGRVAVRSALVAGAMVLYFGCLAFLPIGMVAAGLFTSPIFVVLISWGVLGHAIGPWRVAAVAIGFAGILLVLQPGGGTFGPVAAVPVAAGLLYALGAIATRSWCGTESVLTLLAGFFVALAVYGALGSAILAAWPQAVPEGPAAFLLRGWAMPGPVLWGLIAVQAAGGLLGVGLITRAYALGDAGHVAVVEYSMLVFAGFWALVLYGQRPDALAIAGMGLIALAGAIIALRGTERPRALARAGPRG